MEPTKSILLTARCELIPKIIFEPWKDPLLSIAQRSNDDDPSDNEYEEIRGEFSDEEAPQQSGPSPVLMTPMGIIPINPQSVASRNFNFWIAHTNFPLNARCMQVFTNAPGVEILRIFTPYRAWFAIGKAFDVTEVKNNLEKVLIEAVTPKAKTPSATTGPEWALVRRRDGTTETIKGSEATLVQTLDNRKDIVEIVAASWMKRGKHDGLPD
jgi:hypothetical protein